LPLTVEDLRGQRVEEQEEYLAQWREERKRHVFDWARGPLFHVDIFRRSDESFEFVVSVHHAILDGWSYAALTTMLYNRYERLLSGQELEPASVDWTYRDFIAQEQRALASPASRAYFAAMLEETPAVQLPRLEPPKAGASQERIMVEEFLALSKPLIALAQQMGVPVQTVLLAAHFKVLATVSGQRKAVSCVIYNGRPEQKRAEWSLGLFLNSVPLALELKTGSWRTLIKTVAGMNAASMEHRGYPLAKIQQDLGWQLSEVLFNYTHFHVYRDLTRRAEQTLEAYRGGGFQQTNFDLAVDVSRGVDGETMSLSLTYNAQVLGHGLIQKLGQYYVNAFKRMLEGLDEPHDADSLVTGPERSRLLYGLNQTASDFPRASCLHELFEAQVERTPQSVAVAFEDQEMTFGELNRHANQLAHYLREQGVSADKLVGLCVERSLAMVVGILGILKAGGAYVPLDPSYPRERLEYIIEDSAPVALLTESALQDHFSGIKVPLLRLDTDVELLNAHAADNPQRNDARLTAKSLAYVIYTSGSTGKPKGVMVEHVSVVNLAMNLLHIIGNNPGETWGWIASYAFDASLQGLTQLMLGRTLVVVDGNTRQDAAAMLGLLTKRRIGVLDATPSLLEMWLKMGLAAHLPDLVIGGEAISPLLWKQLVQWQKEHNRRAFNVYGPTECCVNTTGGRIEADAPHIGRPWRNMRCYVLDAMRKMTPEGTAGELYIGGEGVARGYLNQPQLTAERFTTLALSENLPERLYQSGDVVRYRDDGNLEFLGRSDFQVKIRGFRIELGEIEHQLAALPEIDAAVVMAREDAPGRQQLVAYITLKSDGGTGKGREGSDAIIDAIRQRLQARLPSYMVPSVYVVLDALPLTANGKIDRKALPAAGDAPSAGEYIPPITSTETALQAIWHAVLGAPLASVTANFFELGGHSILAIHLIALANQRFGNILALRDIFQMPTVRTMAAHIDSHQCVETEKRTSAPSNLVELKAGQGPARPLFLIHPVGGYAYCYSELAANLDYPGAVLGLQVDGAVPETIEAMARKYLAAIKTVQPEGPFLLGGWSMGGVIAYEINRQLHAAQERADLLLMFDSYCVAGGAVDGTRGASTADERSLLESMAAELGITSDGLGEHEKAHLGQKTLEEMLALVLRLGKEQHRLPMHFTLQALKDRFTVTLKNSMALRAYRPLPFQGEIELIRAMENKSTDWSLGWGSVAAKVSVTEQSGDHYRMLRRPHVAPLAKAVTELIRKHCTDTW